YNIIEGINKKDKYCEKVFDIWKKDLITGLINVQNIFDSESIIISGGMGQFIDVKEIETQINKEIVVSPVKIKLAQSGNYAGMIGAALLACDKFNTDIL
ncbi:MAG: ROK family protein, partial [Candidatus Gastranaerophilales bacterium]|nr:ROK family protein [Candidatus Gastranaerophilales bacterium]